jgi:hypothetical protein
MINLFFFLKFKSQLRRTRPDIIRQVDESLSRAISDAGGKITGDRFVISAVFNENAIGFWLDMYILIENLKKNIETSKEFFGYSLVISWKTPDAPEQLCRFLASRSGVFVDDKAAKRLVPYATFEKPSEWLKGMKRRKYGCGSYYKVKGLKVFRPSAGNELEIRQVVKVLEKEEGKNTLILGPAYLQIRGGLYKYCEELNKNFPPLKICFESIGLGPLVDVWSLSIRSLSGDLRMVSDSGKNSEAQSKTTGEIDALWEFLFRERLRDEASEYVQRNVKRFLLLVFDYYFAAARKKKQTPVIAIENIHLAENNTMNLLLDVLAEVNHGSDRQKFFVLGTGEDDIPQEKLRKWEPLFNNVIKINNIKQNNFHFPKLSAELWEIIYAISLLSRYFSPELFQRLFEEDEKNPAMIARAFSILHTLGIINNMREPRLSNRLFEEHACKILEDKIPRVKTMVRTLLLNWAVKCNINPCFRLLTIIAALEGVKQIDDLMLLKSLSSDIANNTTSAIDAAMKSGQFEDLVTVKAAAIRYIYKTSMVLHNTGEKEIEKVFSDSSADILTLSCDDFPILKTQMLVNLGGYFLGCRNEKDAAEKAKEAILLGQGKNNFCLAHAYRLFSLVCLSKQQTNETIEYLGFALANAEKAGNYHELAVSAYFAAAAQFLYGDVYNAARFARKSIEQSLSAGCPDWADRSRFLEGRLEFELGHYRQALEIFEKIRKDPYGSRTKEKDSLLSAWIYRAKVYFQDSNTSKPQDANYDGDLFEIEAAYLSGDYNKAVRLSSFLNNPFSNENFLYTEQADWRSGFAQCEHLYFTHGEIQKRIKCVFHSLSLSNLPGGGIEEAKQGIQQILRDEKLCEMDPFDAFYFYAKYRILEQAGANSVDMSTAVSMAFKRLQRRAGRIEDIETRHQYLNVPLWNHKLSLAAKDFKLI